MQKIRTIADKQTLTTQGNFTVLFDLLDEGVIVCNKEARIMYLNAPAAKIFGRSKSGLVMAGLDQLVPRFKIDRFKLFISDTKSLEYMFLQEFQAINGPARVYRFKVKKISIGIDSPVYAIFIQSIINKAYPISNVPENNLRPSELIGTISARFARTDLQGIDTTINETLELVGKYFKADRSAFFLFSGDIQYFHLSHQWVKNGIFAEGEIGQSLGLEKLAWLKENFFQDLPIVLNDVESLPLSAVGEWDMLVDSGIISIVCVPLWIQGQLVGFISCQSNTNYIEWNTSDINVIRTVGEIIVSTLKREGYKGAVQHTDFKLPSIFDNAVMGLYRTTPKGEVIMANNALLKLLGYDTIDDLKQINLDRDGYFDSYSRKRFKYLMKHSGEVNQYKSVWKQKNGHPLYVLENSKAIKNNNGEILYYEGSIEDITVKTQHEEESLRLSQVIVQAAVSIIITDINGNIEFVNPFFEKITGYSFSEVAGKKPSIVKSGRQDNNFYKELWGTILSGKVWQGVFSNKSKNGVYFDESAVIFPIFNKAGKLINFAAVKQDISEQYRSRKITNLLYKISNAVYESHNLNELYHQIRKELSQVINTENFFIALYDEANDSFKLPFNTDENDTLNSFPAANSLSMYLMKQRKAMMFNESKIDHLIAHDHVQLIGTKSKVWLGVPLLTNGIPIGVIGLQSYDNEETYTEKDLEILEFVSDQIKLSIERKEAEINLLRAKKKAELSDKLKSSFLSNMSHEIRTPMNSILGFSTLLASGQLSKELRDDYNTHIQEGASKLLKLIEDIFDMSKIEAGETIINKSNFNLVKVMQELQEVHTALKEKEGKQQIGFRLAIDPHLKSHFFYTDHLRLRQILSNLLTNAIKYTQSGTIEFGYTKQGKAIQFYVKDTGIGIPAKKIPYIFNTFTKFSETKTKVYGGTGIGLAISKKLVEFLGGEIWVDSQVNTGSTFYFTLPIEKSTIHPINIIDNEAQDIEYLNIAGRRILVAEDVESNFIFLNSLLKPTGAMIMWAKDGREAIDIIAQNPDIDLILMDIRMPVLNGIEATRMLRHQKCMIPIIAQTAHAFAEDKKEVLEAGCQDYIAKPINPTSLIEKIHRVLIKS